MLAPAFVQEAEVANWLTTAASKTSPAFAVLAGDRVVVPAATSDNGTTLSISNSGTALTWVLERSSNLANNCKVYVWTTTIPADRASLTVTITRAGSTANYIGLNPLTWRGSGGFGVSAITNTSGAGNQPNVDLPGVQANSAVVLFVADWDPADATARAYRTTAGAFTELSYARDAAFYGIYLGYHADAGAAGSKNVGLTAPTGGVSVIAAIEVKGLPLIDRSGSTVSAAAPAGSRVRNRNVDRAGAAVSPVVVAASGNKINPTSNRGTIAAGRISPVRSGVVAADGALSASRSVGSAATYSRSGGMVSAAAPAASRSVTPIGTTTSRTGMVAVGRVPMVRSGSTAAKVVTAVSRIIGSPGATFDRAAVVVFGRIAKSRAGTFAARAKLTGSASLTPRGTIDRTGGGAGGAGGASSGGLLVTLVNHPGPTLSASVRVDSNVPLRTGTVTSAVVASGSRVWRRDRSGVVAVDLAMSGVRVSSGNRNRNGLFRMEVAPQAQAVKVLTSARTGPVVSALAPAASGGVTFAVAYSRGGVLAVPVSTRGAGSLVSDVILHMSFGAPAGRVTVAPTGIL